MTSERIFSICVFPNGKHTRTSPSPIRPIRKLKIRNNIHESYNHTQHFLWHMGGLQNVSDWSCGLSQGPFLTDKHINSNNKTTYLGTKSHVYCQRVLKREKRAFNVRICTFPYWYVLDPLARNVNSRLTVWRAHVARRRRRSSTEGGRLRDFEANVSPELVCNQPRAPDANCRGGDDWEQHSLTLAHAVITGRTSSVAAPLDLSQMRGYAD